jgi:GGDEF domain-containing protein
MRLVADRAELPVSIVLIDLDQFKLVNDGHGHAAGRRTAGRTRP